MLRSKPPQDHTTGQNPGPIFTSQIIGHIRSPYKERFGTPRQPVITEQVLGDAAMPASIELLPWVKPDVSLKGLEGFDYVWAIVWFHLNKQWSPQVTPPRGPKTKQGVFATRSPNRPSQIGLSALKVVSIESPHIHVLGIDLLDGTPVLDIKPYVPYADAFVAARSGWLDALGQPMDAPDRFEPVSDVVENDSVGGEIET